MPPPGYQPFLRAICENPADDAPRLVYADWLDEHGDPDRAEFIRVQIAHARQPDEATGLRAFALLDQFRRDWLADMRWFRDVTWDDEFHRGFVRHATFERPRPFFRSVARVVQAAPVTVVTIRGLDDVVLRRVLDVPEISRFDAIALTEFRASQSRRLWTDIAACPRLATLKQLHIQFDHIDQLNWFPITEFEAEWRWAINESSHLQRLFSEGIR